MSTATNVVTTLTMTPLLRGVPLGLVVVTACGRLHFDPRDDSGAAGGDVAIDALGACAIRQVAIGERHICAVRADGAIFCAGDDAEAQLGNGITAAATGSIVEATELERVGTANVKSVHAGRQFSCVLETSGALSCVGDNADEQLGVTNPSSSNQLIGATTPPLRDVSLGNAYGCGITPDDQLYCWGDGDEGQGGNGMQPDSHLPEAAPTVSGLGLTSLAAGSDHACLVDGTQRALCWGSGTLGRLHYTPTEVCSMSTSGSIPCQSEPLQSASGVVAVAAGHEHSCALLAGSGFVICWGSNDQGQSGQPLSTQVPATQIPSLANMQELRAGRHHNCARDGSDAVWCWGAGSSRQTGGGSTIDSPQPVQVSLSGRARQIASHPLSGATCALLVDGSAECWGQNDFGQLGRGSVTPFELPAPFTIPCP